MRVRHKVALNIAEDTNGTDMLIEQDDVSSEVILDGPQEANCGRASVVAAGTFTVPLGSVASPEGVFLRASGDFDVSINGGAVLQCRRGNAAAGLTKAASVKFFFEGTISSVSVTAIAAMTLTHAVWGDSA